MEALNYNFHVGMQFLHLSYACCGIARESKTNERQLSGTNIISIFSGCVVWIEKSVTSVTDRHHEACRVMPKVIPSDGFFYPHHIPMIDTFSCIPFDLTHLIFKVELDIK